MAFPIFFRRLFEKMGAGPLLRGDILPYGDKEQTVCQGNDARLAGGADWTASKPGIVQRVAALEVGPPAHKHAAGDITSGILPVTFGGTGNAAGKAPTAGTADNAVRWNGSALTCTAAGPIGGQDGDTHDQYI